MKKILILHHYTDIGGAGKSMIQTAKLLKDDYEVFIAVPKDSPIQKCCENEGFNTIPYSNHIGTIEYYSGGPKILSRTYFVQFLRRFSFASYFCKLIKELDTDIILLNSITLSYLIPFIKKAGKQCLLFVRETFPKDGNEKLLLKYRSLLDQTDTVYFLSEYDKDFFELKTTKTVVLKNSIPDDFIININKQQAFKLLNISYDINKYYVLFAGGLQSFKGSEIVKESMQYTNENVEYIICGDSTVNLSEFYSNKVHNLGVLIDMRPALAACDCLLFPSTKAHQARPVFEAGAYKKPVIVSNFEETSEFVINKFNGLLVKPGNPQSLAEAINKLEKDRKLSVTLGNNNYKLTSKNHLSKVAKEKLLSSIK